LNIIFSDLPSPAEAGFAEAENWNPLFGIMLALARDGAAVPDRERDGGLQEWPGGAKFL
jgi:hypothetical protein